ncbi:MAG: transketolase family protein [Nanoarchaeota archaeon]
MKLTPLVDPHVFENKPSSATRDGFGEGLLAAAIKDPRVVALTADLAGSTKLSDFIKRFPKRFVQVGVAEQDLAAVASGLAHVGKIPFITSFAVFSPGRNWEQIRTTICYNDQPVKIVGSHSGLGVGEDGATHQALEDIAITRCLPNMQVVVPADAGQASKATQAIAKTKSPTYLRLSRQKVPQVMASKAPFVIGKAQVLAQGKDIAIIACGPMVYEALRAAKLLEEDKIHATVINCHTIKPIDQATIIAAAKRTRLVLTVEDHQIGGGLGGAVAELLSQKCPTRIVMMGVRDRFGESGPCEELFEKHRLTAKWIAKRVRGEV